MSVASAWPRQPVSLADAADLDVVDVVVVGGGIAGLATAMMLGERGTRVALLTRHLPADTVTGRSNAKVTALHQLVYADLEKRHGNPAARAYAHANTASIGWVREHAGDLATDSVAMTVARDDDEHADVIAEHAAAVRAGLPTSLVEHPAEWPGARSGVRLADQIQVDPVALSTHLLATMPASVTAHHAVVTSVREHLRGVRVSGPGFAVRARHAVIATGLPILDRGGFFSLCEPQASYMVAIEHKRQHRPSGPPMMITAGEPKRSVRWADVDGRSLLLVGGAGHRTGTVTDTPARVRAIEDWARDTFDGLGPTVAAWSAQDFMSPDRLPFAGPLHRIGGPVQVITGLSKWGFTLGVACAAALTRSLSGDEASHFDTLVSTARLPDLQGLRAITGANVQVGWEMASGWARAMLPSADPAIGEGEGAVGRAGLLPCATSQVDGDHRRVSAVCPHLGGVVRWNAVDQTWDCPLHGSRFEPDGAVRHGPAVKGLTRP